MILYLIYYISIPKNRFSNSKRTEQLKNLNLYCLGFREAKTLCQNSYPCLRSRFPKIPTRHYFSTGLVRGLDVGCKKKTGLHTPTCTIDRKPKSPISRDLGIEYHMGHASELASRTISKHHDSSVSRGFSLKRGVCSSNSIEKSTQEVGIRFEVRSTL